MIDDYLLPPPPKKTSESTDDIDLLPPPQKKKSENGSTDLLLQSDQDGMPFKSPTTILSESGGGGSFFPEGAENMVSDDALFRLPTKEEEKDLVAEFDPTVFVTPESFPKGSKAQEFLQGIYSAIDIAPNPYGIVGKLANKAFVGAATMALQGAEEIPIAAQDVKMSDDPAALFEVPAAMSKLAFGAGGTVLPALMAFNTALKGVEEIVPEEYLGAIMMPMSTMLQNKVFVLPGIPPKIYTIRGDISRGEMALAETADVLFQFVQFLGFNSTAAKLKNKEPLTPIDRDNVALGMEEMMKHQETFDPKVLEKIPEEIPVEVKLEAAPLIQKKLDAAEEIKTLETQKQNLDDAFIPAKDEAIKEQEGIIEKANEELKSITEQKKQDTRTEEPTIENVEEVPKVVENVSDSQVGGDKLPVMNKNGTTTFTIKEPFHITTTKDGEVWAKEGDKLTVKDKGAEEYDIVKLNDKQIFYTWKRKKFVESYTHQKIENKPTENVSDSGVSGGKLGEMGKEVKDLGDIKQYPFVILGHDGELWATLKSEDAKNTFLEQYPDFKDRILPTDEYLKTLTSPKSETPPPTVENKPQSILGSDEKVLQQLHDTVIDYKENPSVGDLKKVAKIKKYLTRTPEGQKSVELTQEYLRNKYGDEIPVFRGGERDFGNSDAGWTTDYQRAVDFAARSNGEVKMGTIRPEDILYSDELIDAQLGKKGFNENEIITKTVNDVKGKGYIDVGKFEEGLPESKRYTDLGYSSTELIEHAAQKIKKAGLEVPKDIADKAGVGENVGAVLQEGEPRNLIGATVVVKKEMTGVGGKKKQFEGQVKIVGEEKDSQGNTLYDGRYTDAKGNQRSILLRGEDIKTSDLAPKTEQPTPKSEPPLTLKTKFQLAIDKAAESFKAAQENRRKNDQNLGIVKKSDDAVKKQALLDRQAFDDFLDAAREAINEGTKAFKKFAERIPDEAKRIAQIAWKVANNTLKYEDAVKEVERLSENRDIPPIEPPKGKTDVIEGEPPKEVSGIKKALVSDEIIEGVNLDKIGDKEMMDLGRKILDTGEVKPEAIITNIVSTGKGVLTPKEVVALITHKADLDIVLRDAYKRKNEIVERGEQRGEDLGVINAEISALEGKINNFDVMAVITANQQSMAFRLRKMMLDKDYNVVTQIEKYKANNDGYIPPEVEARFRELGKELDAVKTKLAKAEEAKRLRDEQDAAANITEDVGRKKKRGQELSEEEVVQKVKEGIEAEINDIHSKLSPERKRFADKAIAALDRIQEKIRKNTYSDATGMLAIVDAGITTIKRAIKAGVAVSDAIELGIKKIKERLAKQGVKDWEKENDFRRDMIEGFEAEKISTKKPVRDAPEIKEDGTIKIPNEMIRGLVERGITEIGELTDAVHAEVIKELPNATTRQVRDAITDYGRTVNPTADVIQTQVNAAKRVGRLLSELEDLQNFKQKAKGKQAFKITEKEKDLKRQINALTKNAGLTPEQISLKEQKVRAKNRITELEKRLREKDFAKKPKPVKSTDTEIVELNKEKERLQEEFDKAQYENELKNRTFWQKAEDVALEITNGVFRGLVASLDFSAIFIQGLWRLATSPKQSVKALGEGFRQFASEKRQQEWMNRLKAQEFYPLLEAMKVAITKTEGKISKREELFISNWINLIYNGLGKVITLGHKPSYNVWKAINPYKATGRAFTGYTNAIRVSSALEGAKYLERKGLSFESNPKDFQKWADHVNTVTGRGSLGKAEQSAGWLSTIFFAPRKMIADLKLFTPYVFVYYARFPKAIRQKAVLDYAQAITTVVAANALLWAARRDEDDTEADQFWNPISTNFLTHKFGNTAVSITGGLRTNIVFMSRLFSGKYTDQYGFKSKLGDRYGKQINTRQDLVENFLSNKFSPLISLANKKLDEKKGLELEKSEYTNLAIPMWLQDVRELYKENPKEIGAMMNLLAVFGASVRTIDTHTADSIKHNGKDVELTEQQQEEFSNIYTEKESEYLEKLVNDETYINSSEEEQIKLKQMINDAARNDAEKEIKELYPNNFQETPEEKEAREKEKQDLEDLKIRLGITETPATDPRTAQPSRTQEPNRETTTPSR